MPRRIRDIGVRIWGQGLEDRPALAAGLLMGSLALLSLQDSFVKLLSYEVSLWQFQMLRASINLSIALLVCRAIWGGLPQRPKRIWAVALRAAFLVSAMICFFGGVPFLSLPEIAAGLYIFPFFIALLSNMVLGERVGPRRIVAIILGFGGVLLILKPGTDAFKLVGLMPVGAAFFYACVIMTTRRLCRDEQPINLAIGVAVMFIVAGAAGLAVLTLWSPGAAAENWPYLLTGWHPLAPWMLGIIALCSVLNFIANISMAKSYQSAESSWLAPFDYSYLIFATFWGYVVWDFVPDGFTVLGMAVVAASGGFVAWRERQSEAEGD